MFWLFQVVCGRLLRGVTEHMTETTKYILTELIEDIFITVHRNYERWPPFKASTKFSFTWSVTNMYEINSSLSTVVYITR